jgi:hypothetical protein
MVPNVTELFVVIHAVPQEDWNFHRKKKGGGGQSHEKLMDILSGAGLSTTFISVQTVKPSEPGRTLNVFIK